MFNLFKKITNNDPEMCFLEVLLLFCTIWMCSIISLHNLFDYHSISEVSILFKALDSSLWVSWPLFILSLLSVLTGIASFLSTKTTYLIAFLTLQILFWGILCGATGFIELLNPIVGFSGLFCSTALYLHREIIKFKVLSKKFRED